MDLQALGRVLAHFTDEVDHRASVLVHIATADWDAFKASCEADHPVIAELAQEIRHEGYVRVQFAAGHWAKLRHAHATHLTESAPPAPAPEPPPAPPAPALEPPPAPFVDETF